jgi:hypothetical protein
MLNPGSLSELHLDEQDAVLTRLNFIPPLTEVDQGG